MRIADTGGMDTASAVPTLWEFFNTREWAIGFWLGFGVALVSWIARKSVTGLIKALLNPHFVGAGLIFLAAVVFIVFICQRVGLWDWPQLKTTILWVVFVAPGLISRMIANEEQPRLLRAWFKESVGAVILIELIVNTYTFSIWIEVLLIPFAAVLGVMLAVAQGRPEFKSVVGLLNTVIACAGLYLLGRGLWMIATHWSSFATQETMRDVYTAPLLSLALIPFLYVFYLYVRYETAFAPMQFSIGDAKLRDYAKTMAIVMFNVRTPLLRRWQKQLTRVRPTTRAEVVGTLTAVIRRHNKEKNPPYVDPATGWSPVAAGKFLAKGGVVADDYREGYGGEWFTETSFKRAKGSNYSPHGITYVLEGDESAVHELRLRFHLNGPESSGEDYQRFYCACSLLLENALSAEQAASAIALIKIGKPFSIQGPTRITLEYTDLTVNAYIGGEWVLRLKRPPDVAINASPTTHDDREKNAT